MTCVYGNRLSYRDAFAADASAIRYNTDLCFLTDVCYGDTSVLLVNTADTGLTIHMSDI
jgi:hypothetical protein